MSALLPLPMMSCYLHTGLSPSGLQNYRSFPAITVFWSKCSAYWKHSYSAFSHSTCCENISKFTCYYCKILTKNVSQKLPPITLLSLNERWARPKPSPWFRELSWSVTSAVCRESCRPALLWIWPITQAVNEGHRASCLGPTLLFWFVYYSCLYFAPCVAHSFSILLIVRSRWLQKPCTLAGWTRRSFL